MASVTQQIPNYKLGISELPDELKVPGQVVDLNNGIPDITKGLIKRPGSDLVKAITPASTGKWFPIYREENEQYIGQVDSTGAVKIWRCSDGTEIPVDYAAVPGSGLASYLAHTNTDEIQPLTVNETTLFTNRTKTVSMLTDSTDKSPATEYEAFVHLRTISYGKQYALDIYDPTNHSTTTYNRATAIEADEDVDTSGIGSYSNDGKCEGMNRSSVRPTSTNSGTSYMNGGTGKSNLCYEMDTRCTPIPQDGSTSNAYDDSYQPQATLHFGGEGWSTNDTHDYTSVKGLETQVKVTAHVAITARANIALVRPEPTASNNTENVSAESILSGLKTAIDGISGTGLTVTICGNGLHLRRATPFMVTTPEEQLMEIITNQANDASDLPKICRHGYRVQVINSGEDQDDYYLEFKVNNIDQSPTVADYSRSGTTITVTSTSHGLATTDTIIADFTSGGATDAWYSVASVADANTFTVTDAASGTIGSQSNGISYTPNRFGTGVWEECAASDLEIKFDKDTMPLKLTRIVPSTQYTIATSDVNTSNEQITATAHGRSTGDRVLYDNGGGTALAGLVDDTVYYVIKVDANIIKLATNAANATAGTAINLTGTGNNAQTLTYGYFAINGGANSHYANGAYRFGYPDWSERDVGDDITNPKPSFVDKKINKIFFYRNRIGLLAEENVILSRTNDFYNFWAKTAFTIANADPIDLQSSSLYPTDLFDAIEVNAGLLIFSASQQFLLSTDEAQMTPETARIQFIANYAFDERTVPFSLGVTAGWLNSTAERTRFHEIANIQRQADPQVLEQSKVVSKLFPTDCTLIAESTENSMILFGTVDASEVWGYRFYVQGQNRIQSAWFRWELPGTITWHTMMDDIYYAVIKNGSTYTLEAFNIKESTTTLDIGTSPDDYLIHLDTKKEVATGDLTYVGATNVTTFTLGAGYYSSKQLAAYCIDPGNSAGRFYDIPSSAITGTAPNETVTLPGNWKYEEHPFEHTDVNTTTEILTVSGHGFSTGESVVYKEPTTTGSSAVGGLSEGTTYYVIKVDTNTIKLATNSANATAGTAINLTATGSGTSILQKHVGLVVGYKFEFEVEFPTIYIQQAAEGKVKSETRGSLVIHRINFSFGSVGLIDTTLKRRGRDDYTQTFEALEWDSYLASNIPITDDYIQTVPVYDRNTNLSLHLKSTHPTPATLHSLTWEGDYSNKYYRSV